MKSGRPTKAEQIAIKLRNEAILKMSEQTMTLEYMALYFGLTKGQISKIIKQAKGRRQR